MSHASADALLRLWAAAELAEIRRVWYPPASAGYRDYEAPRDPDTRQAREVRRATADTTIPERVGWVLVTLRRVHRVSLERCYRGGQKIGGHARRAALAAFCRSWDSWYGPDGVA